MTESSQGDNDNLTENSPVESDSVEKIRNSLRMRIARSGIAQAQKVASLLLDAFCEHKCKITEREVTSRNIKIEGKGSKHTDYKSWRLALENHGLIRNHVVTNQEGRMVRQWVSSGRKMDEFIERYNRLRSAAVSQRQMQAFQEEVWENDAEIREQISASSKKFEDFEERLSEIEMVVEALIEIFDPPSHPLKTQEWMKNPSKMKQFINVETVRKMLLYQRQAQ